MFSTRLGTEQEDVAQVNLPFEAPEEALYLSQFWLHSPSPDEIVVSKDSSSPPIDFWAHQDLLKRLASTLNIQVEEVHELSDSLIDILTAAGLGWHFRLMKLSWSPPRF